MKLNSGVKHLLVGDVGHPAAIGRTTTKPPAQQPQRQPGSQRSMGSRVNAPHAQVPARRRRPTLALAGLAASAALLGCSSLSTPIWRIEPVYRVQGGGPSAAAGYLALAQKYEGENRIEQALDAYVRAANSAPDSADVQNKLGLALARHGLIERAIVALRRAVVLAPERASLLNNLAYALLLDGRADEAHAMFKLTLAVDPTHEIALRNVAHLTRQPLPVANAPMPLATAHHAAVVGRAPDPVAASVLPALAAPSHPLPVLANAGRPSALPTGELTIASRVATPSNHAAFSIEIMNGNGVDGAATRMRGLLQEHGIQVRRIANLRPYSTAWTQVLYSPGKAEEARKVAQHMPVHAHVSPMLVSSTLADVRVVIGHDARRMSGCTTTTVCAVAQRRTDDADRTHGRL